MSKQFFVCPALCIPQCLCDKSVSWNKEPERGTRNRNEEREPERGTRLWNEARETLRPCPNSVTARGNKDLPCAYMGG